MIWQFWALFFIAFTLGALCAIGYLWFSQLASDAQHESSESGAAPTSQPTEKKTLLSGLERVTQLLSQRSSTLIRNTTQTSTNTKQSPPTGTTTAVNASSTLIQDTVVSPIAAKQLANDLALLQQVHAALAVSHDTLTARYEKLEHQLHQSERQRERLKQQLSGQTTAHLESDETRAHANVLGAGVAAADAAGAAAPMAPLALDTVFDVEQIAGAAGDSAATQESGGQAQAELSDQHDEVVHQLKRRGDQQRVDLEARTEQVRQLEHQLGALEHAFETAITDWSERVAQLQEHQQRLSAELSAEQAARASLDRQLELSERRAETSEQARFTLEQQLSTIQTQLDTLKHAHEHDRTELDAARASLEATQRTSQTLIAQHETLLTTLKALAHPPRPPVDSPQGPNLGSHPIFLNGKH